MNLYEYESKIILKKFNIKIPESLLIKKKILKFNKIYKIQIHSGYRKKNNGVLLINNKNDFLFFFNYWKKNFLFKKKINYFLIENFIIIEKEIYISFNIYNNYIIFLISEKGGINIEQQKKINFLKLNINFLFLNYSVFDFLSNFYINNNLIKKIIKIILIIYKIFYLKKLILIEINPIVISKNNIFVLDCKIILEKKKNINFSDKISNLFKINYLQLKGNICCIVNGAGLALKTLDYFCFNNSNCFNFIDLSGKITDFQLNKLFIFLLTKKISTLLINIFGGIVSCKKIFFSILNLMYFNFKFKIILKIDGTYSNYVKKKIFYFKNLIIIEKLICCIKKSIIIS